MGPDAKLIALVTGLHLLGMGLAAGLLVMFFRSDSRGAWSPPQDDGGGGGGDRIEPRRPPGPDGGGLPLPDADPPRVRLRRPARLADLLPPPARRPAHTPARAPGRPRVPAGG